MRPIALPLEIYDKFRDRLIKNLEKNAGPATADGCIPWLRCRSSGYGRITMQADGKTWNFLAHRVAWVLKHGSVPSQDIDHLCRNRGCINPDHMEDVSNETNVLRGESPAAQNKRKLFCPVGHEYTLENTKTNRKTGERQCRRCGNVRRRASNGIIGGLERRIQELEQENAELQKRIEFLTEFMKVGTHLRSLNKGIIYFIPLTHLRELSTMVSLQTKETDANETSETLPRMWLQLRP